MSTEKVRVYVDIKPSLSEREWRLYREMAYFCPMLVLDRGGRLSVGVFDSGLEVFVFWHEISWDLPSGLATRSGLKMLRDFVEDALEDFQAVLDGHSLRWSDTYRARAGHFTPEADAAYKRISDRIEALDRIIE